MFSRRAQVVRAEHCQNKTTMGIEILSRQERIAPVGFNDKWQNYEQKAGKKECYCFIANCTVQPVYHKTSFRHPKPDGHRWQTAVIVVYCQESTVMQPKVNIKLKDPNTRPNFPMHNVPNSLQCIKLNSFMKIGIYHCVQDIQPVHSHQSKNQKMKKARELSNVSVS